MPSSATYIAAWLHPRAPLAGALALGVVWSSVDCAALALAASVPVSLWLAVPVVVLIGTVIGGVFRIWGSGRPGKGGRCQLSG